MLEVKHIHFFLSRQFLFFARNYTGILKVLCNIIIISIHFSIFELIIHNIQQEMFSPHSSSKILSIEIVFDAYFYNLSSLILFI